MTTITYGVIFAGVCLLTLSFFAMAQSKPSSEIQIFTNGIIYIDTERKAENIVVKDGKVHAWNVDPAIFKDATVIDLGGGAAYPGFNDSHVHLVEAGLGFSGADLQGCTSSEAIAKVVADLSRKLPEGAPMFGVGFSLEDYDAWSLEDLAKIDKATGSRPVILVDQLGHNMIVNSASMAKCNVTKKTPVPMGGKIIFQHGKPTGMLRESAMTVAANTLVPLFSNDIIRKGAQKFFNHWASMGYTSIVDLMGAPLGRILKPDLCKAMEKEGVLPLRVNYMYTFFSLDEIDNALEYVGKDTDMVRFGGLKLFVDGAYAGGQAWTTWKNAKGDNGLYYVYTDDTYGKQYNINRIVEKVNDLGLNIHYHVQGDQAIEAVLDALDAAVKKKGYLTSTHTLIHLAYPTEDQIARMKEFGGHVVATVQPAFWKVEEDLSRYYGDREKSAYPIMKLMESGVSTGISTDFSVSPLELSAPTTIMGISMTGAGDPANHKPLGMKELIRGLTVGSAATTPKQDMGMLDVGYKADIVVYDKDLYSVSPDKLGKDNPKVMSTWIGGRKVYESP